MGGSGDAYDFYRKEEGSIPAQPSFTRKSWATLEPHEARIGGGGRITGIARNPQRKNANRNQ